MGRGRAKAKQTKVARKLKYQTIDTDLDSLQRELSGSSDDASEHDDAAAEYEEFVHEDDEDDEDDGYR
jgi:hypothetical protein